MAGSDSNSISIKILFFAQARELTKLSEGKLSIEGRKGFKPRELLEKIVTEYSSLKPLENCVILAYNQSYIQLDSDEELHLSSNDEIAIIPPISSG